MFSSRHGPAATMSTTLGKNFTVYEDEKCLCSKPRMIEKKLAMVSSIHLMAYRAELLERNITFVGKIVNLTEQVVYCELISKFKQIF